MKLLLVMILVLSLRASGSLPQADPPKPRSKPILIAHRGASAYAPEHTQAAYELAIKQGADYVEQDLQMTRDGVLICSHDAELSRTTNVEEVFPDRAVVRNADAKGPRKGWYAVDFTLTEIKMQGPGLIRRIRLQRERSMPVSPFRHWKRRSASSEIAPGSTSR